MSQLLPWMAPWSGWTIELLLAVAGALLTYCGLFGDRSRGRPRCPRCWYDRTGLPAATCPECGHAIRRPRDAFRARRRWPLALAGLLLAAALPAYVVQFRVRQFGWDYYLRVGPLYWVWPDQVVQARDVAGYRVEVLRDRRSGYDGGRTVPVLRIRRGLRTMMQFDDGWWWNIGFDDGASGAAAPLGLGQDLTGNGVPDLLLTEDQGGSGTTTLYVIELGPKAPVLLARVGQTSFDGVKDLDGDGRAEIILFDRTFQGWHCCEAASPAPKVVLSWSGRDYAPNLALTRRLAPAPADTEEAVNQARRALAPSASRRGVPYEDCTALWSPMLDLIYAGRADDAYRFLDAAWPAGVAGKAQFLDDFQDQLGQSPYRDALERLGHPPLVPRPRPNATVARR